MEIPQSEEVIEIRNVLESSDDDRFPRRVLQPEGEHPEEVIRYATEWLRIDPVKDANLMSLVYDGYYSPLPPFWTQKKKLIKNEDDDDDEVEVIVYTNVETGEVLFRHPMDSFYRRRARMELEKKYMDKRKQYSISQEHLIASSPESTKYRTRIHESEEGGDEKNSTNVYWSFRGETSVKLHQKTQEVKRLEEHIRALEKSKNEEIERLNYEIKSLEKTLERKTELIDSLKMEKSSQTKRVGSLTLEISQLRKEVRRVTSKQKKKKNYDNSLLTPHSATPRQIDKKTVVPKKEESKPVSTFSSIFTRRRNRSRNSTNGGSKNKKTRRIEILNKNTNMKAKKELKIPVEKTDTELEEMVKPNFEKKTTEEDINDLLKRLDNEEKEIQKELVKIL